MAALLKAWLSNRPRRLWQRRSAGRRRDTGAWGRCRRAGVASARGWRSGGGACVAGRAVRDAAAAMRGMGSSFRGRGMARQGQVERADGPGACRLVAARRRRRGRGRVSGRRGEMTQCRAWPCPPAPLPCAATLVAVPLSSARPLPPWSVSAPTRGGAATVPAGGCPRTGRQERRASCAGGRRGQLRRSEDTPRLSRYSAPKCLCARASIRSAAGRQLEPATMVACHRRPPLKT